MQRVRLDGKASASVSVVSRVRQGSLLGSLFVLYTSELLLIDGNCIVGHADDTSISAVNPRPLSRPQVSDRIAESGFDSN